MKEYIKTILIGVVIGACLMQLTNKAVDDLIKRNLVMGGEIMLPVLVIMAGFVGWKLCELHFGEARYREIYRKGYDAGAKIHSYKIVIPIDKKDLNE